MYETLLTNEECSRAIDMGDFYRVPSDNRGLNYDKYFKDGDVERNPLSEFDSNNTALLGRRAGQGEAAQPVVYPGRAGGVEKPLSKEGLS